MEAKLVRSRLIASGVATAWAATLVAVGFGFSEIAGCLVAVLAVAPVWACWMIEIHRNPVRNDKLIVSSVAWICCITVMFSAANAFGLDLNGFQVAAV